MSAHDPLNARPSLWECGSQEVAIGQVWRSLDARDVARDRTVEIEEIAEPFVYARSYLGSYRGRRTRIHRSRFDGVQFEKVVSL